MNTQFSPPIRGAKFLPTDLKNLPMVISSPFGTNLSTFSYLPILCVPDAKNEKNLTPISFFHCRLTQITLDFINKLINLSYTFRTPFKISIKDILMATSSHTHDGV